MTKFIRYYREHHADFVEEYHGCGLYPYQKEMLNKMYKNNQSYYKW